MGAITRNFANNILGTGQLDATDGVDGNIPAPNVNNESLDNITALPPAVGFGVKTVSSDPPSLNEGEIFFNSTDSVFKALVNVEAWSSGASILTATTGIANTGTQTASVAYGGNDGSATDTTLEYDGTGWSTSGDVPEARSEMSKAGTQTAVISTGGKSSPPGMDASFEYDGSRLQ